MAVYTCMEQRSVQHKHKHTYIDRTCAKDKHYAGNNMVVDL